MNDTPSPMTNNTREASVCAVIVTYNRLELLKQALAAVLAQSRRVDCVLVVDNGSTDETSTFLAEQCEIVGPQLQVLTQTNLGGAGGFHAGLQRAFALGHTWFWCMDDDTIPATDCLDKMLEGAERHQAVNPEKPLGWVCSVVHWVDGALHKMNEPRLQPFTQWGSDFLARRSLPARWCSCVSVMVAREALANCGLPIKEMFIWYDDVEFTARITEAGFSGALILDSFAEHRTKTNYETAVEDLDASNVWRFRYAFRNEVLVLKTLHGASGRKFQWNFIRLMIRRLSLMLRARKYGYLGLAIKEGLNGWSFNPGVDFPSPPAPASTPKIATAAAPLPAIAAS